MTPAVSNPCPLSRRCGKARNAGAFRSPIGGEKLPNADDLARENGALRDRLSRLSEASLRINESLDLDTVLQGVLDSARSLTGARYGVLTLLDDSGGIRDFLSSGMTAEEAGQLWDLPGGMRLFEYLSGTFGAAAPPRPAGPHPVAGPSRVPPAPGAGAGGVLPGGAGPPPGGARRQRLRRGEGSRA